jgi:hypothetical protein
MDKDNGEFVPLRDIAPMIQDYEIAANVFKYAPMWGFARNEPGPAKKQRKN